MPDCSGLLSDEVLEWLSVWEQSVRVICVWMPPLPHRLLLYKNSEWSTILVPAYTGWCKTENIKSMSVYLSRKTVWEWHIFVAHVMQRSTNWRLSGPWLLTLAAACHVPSSATAFSHCQEVHGRLRNVGWTTARLNCGTGVSGLIHLTKISFNDRWVDLRNGSLSFSNQPPFIDMGELAPVSFLHTFVPEENISG